MTKRIMVVEDESIVAQDIHHELETLGYSISAVASSASEAIHTAAATRPDLVLMDIMLGDNGDGVEAAAHIRDTLNIPVVYLTAHSDPVTLQRAKISRPFGYIVKPFEQRELYINIEIALYAHELEQRLKESAQWLATANLELQSRSDELDTFARTVAHSLSNPAEIIAGYVDVLEKSTPALSDAERSKYLRTIARSARRMGNIVKELFLLSEVRAKPVETSRLDMAAIVAEAQQCLVDMIEEKHAEIVLPAAWPAAQGYAPWVEEIWINYIGNAIKYGGQPPRIELGATPLPSSPVQAGEGGGGGYIRFWVRDNGPGITPENQARLFTLFTRLDQARAKGHGLGLSIVHRIVERLGGRVGVESQLGCGSVFSFTLPAA